MKRILLIEDDPDTGETLQAMLVALGHDPHWVRNGLEALDWMKTQPSPDLILTDIMMPGMDGLEAIQQLRHSHPDVNIIAVSAQLNAPYLQAAAVYGAQVTLAKPFSLEALRGALAKVIDT